MMTLGVEEMIDDEISSIELPVELLRIEENRNKEKEIERVLYGHKIAGFLSKYKWYNPHKNDNYRFSVFSIPTLVDEKKASLDIAWEFFQKVTLPRRVRVEKGDKNIIKVEAGDETEETVLYSPFRTPEDKLGAFGVGIGVYFSTLRILAIVCFFAGLLYIPTLMYYSSDAYSLAGEDNAADKRYSAMCSTTRWTACPNCANATDHFYAQRFVNHTHDGKSLTFAERSDCPGTEAVQGLNHICVTAFLVASLLLIGKYQARKELKFDEDNLTASDYSIKVMNPPKDALDPEEWKDYFSSIESAVPVYVTICIDNDRLINKLAKRRSIMFELSTYIPNSINYSKRRDFEEKVDAYLEVSAEPPMWKKIFYCGMKSTFAKVFDKYLDVTEECEELMKQKYNVASVFVSFEYEADQRRVLKALSVGRRHVNRNNINALQSPEHAFRGKHLLNVREANEPTTIRWNDQGETRVEKLTQRACTFAMTAIILVMDITLVELVVTHFDAIVAAQMIAFLNFFVPQFFIALNRYEAHTNSGSYQASLFIKLCAFRWINSAVALLLAFDFTQYLHKGGLIDAVRKIFIADMMTAPALQLLDLGSNFKRHILGPRQFNQGSMNIMFTGTELNIAERYANMTKIIFVSLFYAVIFPIGYIFSAIALAIQYYVDKFSLMRSWGPQPDIGNDIAHLNRVFFFPAALVIITIMQTYFWVHFPFDNLCETGLRVPEEYVGDFTLPTNSGRGAPSLEVKFTIKADANMTEPCFQHILAYPFKEEYGSIHFPPISFHDIAERGGDVSHKFGWMGDTQKIFAMLYQFCSLIVLIAVLATVIYRGLKPYIESYFYGTYDNSEEVDSGEKYTDQPGIKAYVPMIKNSLFEHPLLACDISAMNPSNIGFKDPFRSYDFYSLVQDAEWIKSQMEQENVEKVEDYLFSKISYFGRAFDGEEAAREPEKVEQQFAGCIIG